MRHCAAREEGDLLAIWLGVVEGHLKPQLANFELACWKTIVLSAVGYVACVGNWNERTRDDVGIALRDELRCDRTHAGFVDEAFL